MAKLNQSEKHSPMKSKGNIAKAKISRSTDEAVEWLELEASPLEASEHDSDVVEVVGEIVSDTPVEIDLFDTEMDPEDEAQPVDEFHLGETIKVAEDRSLARRDSLQVYLDEVQKHPLLTSEQEKDLTQAYLKTKDIAIASKLVTSNLRLVVKLAYEYRKAYKNIMDLIQEGNIGLMQAVKRYDPYRGTKLSSYAAFWIRAYILRFILNNWRLVKLGTTQAQRKLFFNLNKEKAKLSALGINPTVTDLAQRLDVDEQEVIDMDLRLSSSEASLDAPVGDQEGRSVSRAELLPTSSLGPDQLFEDSELGSLVHTHLQEFRKTIKGKELIIFDKRIASDEPLTLQELGGEFGISRERVRQLEARLASKLRVYLHEKLGDAVTAEDL